MYLLVLGSGVLPVHFGVLILIGALGGFSSALLAARFGRDPRRFRVMAFVAVLATLAICVGSFAYFQRRGFDHAKRYGAEAATAITRVHATTGVWPESLARTLEPSVSWPFEGYCRRDGLCKVGGYFVEYGAAGGTPRLTVTRRGAGLSWDWTRAQWSAADSAAAPYPPAREAVAPR